MNHDRDATNLLLVGTGGQGVITAADIIAETALAAGFDVKKAEIAGMAQRGGSVTAHLRWGRRVLSPVISRGEADLLLAFEPAEAVRWAAHLRPGGLVLVNTRRVIPPVVTMGLHHYTADPIADLTAQGLRVIPLDAAAIAREVGEPRATNMVMLGAVARLLPLPRRNLRDVSIGRFHRRNPDLAARNAAAWYAGQAAAESLGDAVTETASHSA